MSALRIARTIPWSKAPKDDRFSKVRLVVDDAGRFALVRYLDARGGLCTGILWDLDEKAPRSGEHIALHSARGLAVRRSAKGSAVVDLGTGRTLLTLPGRPDVSFAPDAPFVVQEPRGDAIANGERPLTRVYSVEGGPTRELPTRSILEAFVGGGRLATVARTGIVTFWDIATGKSVGTVRGIAKPASIRVDASGATLGLSASDGGWAVVDVTSQKVIRSGKSRFVFVRDASFDGVRWVATNQLLDTVTKRGRANATGWMKGARHGNEHTIVVEYPKIAVLTRRTLLGDPTVELWDLETDRELGSTVVKPRAEAIAFAANRIVTAHLPVEDTPASPAISVVSLASARRSKSKSA